MIHRKAADPPAIAWHWRAGNAEELVIFRLSLRHRQTKAIMPPADGSQRNLPEGRGFIPFRPSQRKGIRNKTSVNSASRMSDLSGRLVPS